MRAYLFTFSLFVAVFFRFSIVHPLMVIRYEPARYFPLRFQLF